MVAEQSDRRVALVTGASYGLGAEIARTMARDGFDVAATELNIDDLADTVASIEGEGARAVAIALDVRSMDNIENAVAETIDRLGKVDVLVNNAGRLLVKPALEIELDEWNQVMAVNVTGSYFMSQRVARHMIDADCPGCIINIASTFTVMGAPNALRGQSHSGNTSARELIAAGLCDVLASDYMPSAMLASVFAMATDRTCTLPEAVALVTKASAASSDDDLVTDTVTTSAAVTRTIRAIGP